DNRYSINLAVSWLLQAQLVNGDNGYAHSYSLLNGWAKSYPETTGYIIPTMLAVARFLGDERYSESAMKAGEWLLGIQQDDGSFTDMDGNKQVFDTGQILGGLLANYSYSRDDRFFDAAIKAGNFLVAGQDDDGKWTKFSYNGICHTYYSKVASNLSRLYAASDDKKYYRSAVKNIEWVLKQQHENGYFGRMSFTNGQTPYLHTIIYVLEGLMDHYAVTSENDTYLAVKKSVNALLTVTLGSGLPIAYSQYDEQWRHKGNESCLTGLAQWAGLLLNLYKMENSEYYYSAAEKTIDYLKSKQIQNGRVNLKGAIPGSAPIWGSYFKFSFNNWTVKYFIDALLSLEKVLLNGKG
ncbi:MAG TPA: hypothetical protein PLV52_07080, partial [Candidatus Omnitrophota bacterium]|nr:hypothetical protein [Candidatus Omnitrophota bacterium]